MQGAMILMAHFLGLLKLFRLLHNLILLSQAHTVQLEAFSVALKKLDADLPRPKLQFVGSCRNKSDEERLQNLKNKAIELKVDGDVEFYKNLMYRFEPVKLDIGSLIRPYYVMCNFMDACA